MFVKRYHFNPTMAPFDKRTHVPEWFTRPLPTTSEQEAKSKRIWEAFLIPKILLTRLGTSRENVKILFYQPNLVSHQFGFSQTVPRPFFSQKSELFLFTVDIFKDELLRRIA